MIYFTSDLHLGHENVIEFSNRPFIDVADMNNSLISNINDVVRVNDELWILGDFAYKVNREEVRKFREKIKCHKVHLIRGNHDKDYSKDDIFSSVDYYKELKTDYGRFILFHYPIREWNAAHYGSVHLHGHIHSTMEYNEDNLTRKYSDRFKDGHSLSSSDLALRIYDVGVDANNYKPVSLDYIAKRMNLSIIKEGN